MIYRLHSLVLLLGLGYAIHAANWIDRLNDRLLMADFVGADSILQARETAVPASVTVRFYRCSYENARKDYYEDLISDSALEASANRVIRMAEDSLSRVADEKKQASYLFYMGSAYGFLAMHRGRSGWYVQALSDGYHAVDYLKNALKADSTLNDAALGLGAYNYWTSARLSWLPFRKDRRAEGIRQVIRSANKGRYSRYMAIHQLVYMLLDYGRYAEAERYALKGVAAYPQSPYMLWALSHVYMKQKRLKAAAQIYRRLESVLLSTPQGNPRHLVVCRARLADMLSRGGECRLARKRAEQILRDEWYHNRRDDDETERLLKEVRERCGALAP